MMILGISCFYHDAAAVLLKDGVLVAAAEEERFSRIKHDSSFPERAVAFCLAQAGINAGELDYVVFYEKPLPKFERILMTTLSTVPRSLPVFREAMLNWLGNKLWMKVMLVNKLKVDPQKVLFVDHHLSHAASAFFCSPFHESAILTVDGVGEWTTTAIGRATADWGNAPGARNQITLDDEIRYPHSLGLLYSAFTAFLGFQVNEGEYKVMGMAPYGQPRYLDEVSKLIRVGSDGSFQLDMDYFSFHNSADQTYSKKFLDLFGPARKAESPFVTSLTHADANPHDAAVQLNQHYADVAASIQRVTEDTLLSLARAAHKQTGSPNLCIAGGVALNSVANARILRESPFQNVFIQPAAGDSGGALGAALYVHHVLLGQPRQFTMEHAYWGRNYDEQSVAEFLTQENIKHEYIADDGRLMDCLVDELTHGRVVGWWQGRSEWGPRALGNRSILADPRRAEMKDIVNAKIKFREPFRPFAPVIPEERTNEFFELSDPAKWYPARFMLLVTPVHEAKRETIPAVTHVGGTGRLQTIRREWNPRYYGIVERFGQATGVPVLLNTSFNLRGEPIVDSPRDAFKTFSNSGIDVLALGNYVVRKAQPA